MMSDRMWWCALCQGGEGHCFGTGLSQTQKFGSEEKIKCQCDCQSHTLSEDDVRQDMITLLTAEAHDEYAMLKQLIAELPEDRARMLLLLMTKYVTWMVRESGFDVVQMVQTTALYWSGGEPEEPTE